MSRDPLLDILESNQGFSVPERWIDYARRHNFTKIPTIHFTCCPDCKYSNGKKVGQYIYYSNLINLKVCDHCGLVYSDTRIDIEVTQNHFENAYKDEDYFLVKRKGIVDMIARLVDRYAPRGGNVIDIGGAKGHLMVEVRRRRHDLKVTISDLSMSACAWSKSHHQFETICGSAADLDQVRDRFNVVTMIDTLYYEARISEFWNCLPQLVVEGGAIIIRVPNKFRLIVLREFLAKLVTTQKKREMVAQIKYFNPEHVFVFSREYLRGRLKSLGFTRFVFMPSPLLVRSEKLRLFCTLYYQVARLISALSFGRIVITPSLLAVARRVRV